MIFRQALPRMILMFGLMAGPAHADPWLAGGTQWRPFSYEDEHGNLRGISTDIARRILELANIDAQLILYPVNRLQVMLARGELDMNYADSTQWNSMGEQRMFAFSAPYMTVREYLYFLKDDPAVATPVDKLDQLVIGTVRGYTYRTMDSLFENHRLTRLETSEDPALLKLLQAGRVDAVAMVDELFEFLIVTNGMDRNLFQRGAQLSESPISLKLQTHYGGLLPQINAAILTMIRSGEVTRIRKSYLPSNTRAGCQNDATSCAYLTESRH